MNGCRRKAMENVTPLRALDVPAAGRVADISTTPLRAATGVIKHVAVVADVAATAGQPRSIIEQKD
jgi:hypothetical protein